MAYFCRDDDGEREEGDHLGTKNLPNFSGIVVFHTDPLSMRWSSCFPSSAWSPLGKPWVCGEGRLLSRTHLCGQIRNTTEDLVSAGFPAPRW